MVTQRWNALHHHVRLSGGSRPFERQISGNSCSFDGVRLFGSSDRLRSPFKTEPHLRPRGEYDRLSYR
jgi:hypothetical protein